MSKAKFTIATALSAAVLLAGCNPPPQPVVSQKTENGMDAELIAVVDGCRVWFIRGAGHTVYLANCGPGPAKTQWTVASGKTRSVRTTVPGDRADLAEGR